jgi:hypothetical protein
MLFIKVGLGSPSNRTNRNRLGLGRCCFTAYCAVQSRGPLKWRPPKGRNHVGRLDDATLRDTIQALVWLWPISRSSVAFAPTARSPR